MSLFSGHLDKKKILVVDDSEDILKILEKRLTQAGYAVFKAMDGKSAIEIAQKEIPDLVILDVVLPDITGSEIAAQLKEDPKTQEIQVIFLTAIVSKKEEKNQGHEIGGRIIFAKPFESEELLQEIKKQLK